MKTSAIKTIDIQAKEWFDKVNGSSYFSAIVTVNFGLQDQKTINVPFQYGYGDFYIQGSENALVNAKLIPGDKPFWRYCKENNIILRYNKQTNCLKRDVKNFTN